MTTILPNTHTSPESAYVVDDYPYGFRLRCRIRYWIETDPKHGCRMVSQTSNPKRPGLVWNKPKASTYCRFGAALFLENLAYTELGIAAAVPEPANATLLVLGLGALVMLRRRQARG